MGQKSKTVAEYIYDTKALFMLLNDYKWARGSEHEKQWVDDIRAEVDRLQRECLQSHGYSIRMNWGPSNEPFSGGLYCLQAWLRREYPDILPEFERYLSSMLPEHVRLLSTKLQAWDDWLAGEGTGEEPPEEPMLH